MVIKVKVTGAPGFEVYEGWTTPDIHQVSHPDGELRTVVFCDEDGGVYVFKSKYVEEVS